MLTEKTSYLLSDLMNFNETLTKDVTYDNTKSHKKPRLHLSLGTFFEKLQWK